MKVNSRLLARYETSLRGLQRKHRWRSLQPRKGVDFSSNDYLGLARSPRLKAKIAQALEEGVALGATGSRLLRGNSPEHMSFESKAANFFGAERALLFNSGFLANVAILSTLPQKGDLILLDELIHASAHSAMAGARGTYRFLPHNRVEAFEAAIISWRQHGGLGAPWIVVESLYSMDGDFAPLADFADLARRHDGFLFIDEAHATGIYGPHGRGLAHELEGLDHIIILHTLGKALGISGGVVTCCEVLAEYMINRCSAFIYATAPSPLLTVAAGESLDILRDEPWRRENLARLVDYAGQKAHYLLGQRPSQSQILPIVVKDNSLAVRQANLLQAQGFDVRAIRPPTVPEGTARLRLSITLNIRQEDIDALFFSLSKLNAPACS